MVSIARKNLFAEKTRLLISVGGVAFSVLLILILFGLFQGWRTIVTNYIEHVGADIWVVQKGASDMFHSVSIVSSSTAKRIGNVDGVEDVQRLLGRQVSFEIGGEEVHTFLFGYDVEKKVGGPLKVVDGKKSPGRGEIIIDEVFSRNNNLGIGDRLDIGDRGLTVVGIATGGNLIVYQYAFTTEEDAEEIFELQNLTNFFLVNIENGESTAKVKERIEDGVDDIESLSQTEFIKSNQKIIDDSFLPIIAVLVVIGFFVGVAVIGLTIYNATIEKSKEYGILKAIGISNFSLYKIIFQQSFIAALLGFLIGILLTFAVSYLATMVVPEFVTSLRWQDFLLVFVAALLMSVLAAYLPIRRIAKIDPAEVFKA